MTPTAIALFLVPEGLITEGTMHAFEALLPRIKAASEAKSLMLYMGELGYKLEDPQKLFATEKQLLDLIQVPLSGKTQVQLRSPADTELPTSSTPNGFEHGWTSIAVTHDGTQFRFTEVNNAMFQFERLCRS